MAAKSAAILDRHSTRWRSRTAVGAEEWLRRGQTKEWARKQVSCQDFVITIREGRHQFSWHKKQEQSRISPSDTVVVLRGSGSRCFVDLHSEYVRNYDDIRVCGQYINACVRKTERLAFCE